MGRKSSRKRGAERCSGNRTGGRTMQIKLNLSKEAKDKVIKQLAIYSYAAKVRDARVRK